MKKIILLAFLVILPIYLFLSLYFLDKCYFFCPVEYKREIIIRSDDYGDGFFGAKRSGNRLHQGLDLFAEVGTPVLAARSGEVIAVSSNNGMGKYVIVRHPGGITTIYGHLSQIFAFKGQFVRQGQVIGAVGKTGNADNKNMRPHLHLEVRKNNIHQDPWEYLNN